MKEEHADVTNAQRRLFDELVGKLWKKILIKYWKKF